MAAMVATVELLLLTVQVAEEAVQVLVDPVVFHL